MKKIIMIAAALSVLLCQQSWAGNISISPIRLTLKSAADSATLTLKNNGEEKVTVQVQAKKWIQDENGADQFLETEDVVFFPGLLEMEKGDERIIRIGYDAEDPGNIEKTYRIFVSELPVKKPGETALKFAITMSVPVFLAPSKKGVDASIEGITIDSENVSVTIKNAGNVHVMPKNITVVGMDKGGNEIFTKEVKSWYVLAGVSRTFSSALEAGECEKAATLRVTADVEKIIIDGKLEVDGSACSH